MSTASCASLSGFSVVPAPAIMPIALGRRSPGDPDTLRAAAGEIVRVVSAFTAAHSTTLALAALGFVTLAQPSLG